MELMRKEDGGRGADDYERISGGACRVGCSKKVVAGTAVVSLLLVVIVVAVFIKGSSERTDRWVDLPPIAWDGDCPAENECPESFRNLPPPLLLISLDGFRPDYLNRGNKTPTLTRLAKCGVRARYLNPVYPSKTFPNHYTQVTGLYPSSHGIIDNSIYDPDTRRTFKLGSRESFDPEWWQKEPIWVSAEKQGKKTATFFWPGSDVEINGTRPSIYKNYSTAVPFETRVLEVLSWLDLPPPLRPAFITLYFTEPDKAAHEHGIHSRQVDSELLHVDRMLEGLFAGLQKRNLTGCVNVMIASDHGMADIACDRVVDIRDYINVSDVRSFVGTFARVRPLDNTKTSELESSLRCRSEHLRVFRKEDLPIRMHYSENPRIEPLILDTDVGWTFFKSDYLPSHKWCTGAAHGYDHLFPDMRAFFAAIGPSLRRNATVEPFLNVELYELLCELIGITPNPNNGTRGSLHHLLRASSRLPPRSPTAPLETARVAEDAKEYAKRMDEARCPCTQSRSQLDPSEDDDAKRHLPFGAPSSTSSDIIMLRNTDYVIGYDVGRRVAEWAAFTLVSTQQIGNVTADVCWTGDARMSGVSCPNNETLRQEGLIQWPLYPPTLSRNDTSEEASHVTNSMTVSLDFVTAVGGGMWRIITDMEESSHLHVVTGPVFATRHSSRDTHNDTLPVPSHQFVLLTSCSQASRSLFECPPADLAARAFLMPSHPNPNNCEPAERVIARNVARVVDIEGATGLEFNTGLPTYDAIRLRTALPPSN